MLAVGLLGDKETGKILSHAAGCLWCGALLRDSAEDLRPETTEEEEAFVAQSKWANPVDRRMLAERLARGAAQETGEPKRRFPWKFWVPAAAFAAAMGTGGVFLWPMYLVNQTEGELAKAYTQFRPMEMRVPRAEYRTLATERGAEPPRITRSPDLLEAEARILREVNNRPDDPQWLHLAGRASLLLGKDDEAIAQLERAHSIVPEDAYVLSDLGIAYFQKAAKTADSKLDASAFEYVAKAEQLRPKDPVLWFNRALAAERIYAFHDAGRSWEQYLRIDSKSDWAAEARAHLREVKKNLSAKQPISPLQIPVH
ncbi:MAG: hypothetical protein U0Q18_01425 [Bryobacteraceae bacterium]